MDYQPQTVREHLELQDMARLKRDAHTNGVEARRLREQVRWLRKWLLGYAGETTVKLLEDSVPGVFQDERLRRESLEA